MPLIVGSSSADTLTGSAADDTIQAGFGNDLINASPGVDTIDGEAGLDIVFFNVPYANAVVTTANGVTTVDWSGARANLSNVERLRFTDTEISTNPVVLQGTAGADTITGSAADDSIVGGAGADVLDGAGGYNTVEGGAGDDRILFSFTAVRQQFDGGDGYDTLQITLPENYVTGVGSSRRDISTSISVTAGEGNVLTGDVIYTSSTTIPSPSATTITFDGFVARGVEEVNGSDNADTFLLGSLTTGIAIRAGGGNDRVVGGSGSDTLDGGDGRDTLDGGAGDDLVLGGAGADTLISAAGNDTVDGGTGTDSVSFEGRTAGVNLTLGVTAPGALTVRNVETVFGSTFNDRIVGDNANNLLGGLAGADTLSGGLGNDSVIGGDGDDRLSGDGGFDLVDGGSGNDILLLTGSLSDYTAGGAEINFLVRTRAASNTDQVRNVERISLDGGATSMTVRDFMVQTFDPLRYLASYSDLRSVLGSFNVEGARAHYLTYGLAEGRESGGFDVWGYLASNKDLALAFGADKNAALTHYLTYGVNEGRSTTAFDAWTYTASHTDLIRAFGADADAALTHYLTFGAREGRAIEAFDANLYLASNIDVLREIGSSKQAAAFHYIAEGFAAGRATSGFNALLYGASNADLARVFGSDTTALVKHFVTLGVNENRALNTFDARLYLASNESLARDIGLDAQAGLLHYLDFGADANLPVDRFDAVAYLLSYGDLRGLNASQALDHYLTTGADAGRDPDGFFGLDQTAHALPAFSAGLTDTLTPGDKDWFSFTAHAGDVVSLSTGPFTPISYHPILEIFDSTGNSLGVYSRGMSVPLSSDGTYYVVVSGVVSEARSYFLSANVRPAHDDLTAASVHFAYGGRSSLEGWQGSEAGLDEGLAQQASVFWRAVELF